VVVGLNPALKGPELIGLLSHSGAECLFVDARHPEAGSLGRAIGPSTRVVKVELGKGIPGQVAPDPGTGLDPESLAVIVYTSGTTGDPKGVTLTHRNLAVNADSILQSLPVREEDRAICVLPFQYSYGSSVLNTHLVTGGTLVLERSFMYPHSVLERMVRERVTTLAGVPSTFRILMHRTRLSEYDLSSLRYVTVAGGPLGPLEISGFRELIPDADVFVMYGQTEASPRLSCYGVQEPDPKGGSAGKAIPGVELCIRDERGIDLPAGGVGEVCAKGENVMKGYWAEPEETAEVLRDGWLYTGDQGHLDGDGYLFLQGRLREMIKSGAHRIAPSEIEEVIRDVPGVRDVVVMGIQHDLLGQIPKAWVIPNDANLSIKKRILHECQRRLARFKVPKDVELRNEFPRTASGKVQKHLLYPGDQSAQR
jgi:acyl-CoA synthetase (AMP-forming)/AMP-acid ligase II